MDISLAMIVRNEQANLPRALARWRRLADELVIVDTGSTDDTVRIATDAGAQVLRYVWQPPGHKGEARNVGIDAATGDWIVVLDADEEIADPAELRRFLLEDAADLDMLDVQFQNVTERHASLVWWQPRIFRRGVARYVHREHELPIPHDPETLRRGRAPTVFRHYGNDAAGKNDAMLARLQADHAERPDDLHALYFLARQYLINGEAQHAVQTLREYISRARAANGGRLADAYNHLGKALELSGDIPNAFEAQHLAVAWEPCRREFWIHLASMYRHYHSDHALALAYMQAALTIPGGRGAEQSPQADQKLLAMWNHSQEMIWQT